VPLVVAGEPPTMTCIDCPALLSYTSDRESMDSGATTHRTTVDIDVDAYLEARRALGTRGYRDTINEALREVTRAKALRRGAGLIRKGGLTLVKPDELSELRKPRG